MCFSHFLAKTPLINEIKHTLYLHLQKGGPASLKSNNNVYVLMKSDSQSRLAQTIEHANHALGLNSTKIPKNGITLATMVPLIIRHLCSYVQLDYCLPNPILFAYVLKIVCMLSHSK
jgi:hypothetical protein